MKIENFKNDDPNDDSTNNPNGPSNNQGNGPPPINGGHGVSANIIPPPDDPQDDERPEALINYNEKADTFDKALFRDEEIDRMITILSSKKKANALLVGDAGVGKTQIVEEFARRYEIDQDPVLIERFGDDLQIEELRISSLISGKSVVGQLEQEVEKVLNYTKETNSIVFIDELHRLFSPGPAQNISQDLKQALGRGDVQFIGATTTQEVEAIREESAFNRRWSDVIVDELTPEQTETILRHAKSGYEKYHNVRYPDHLLSTIVRYGDLYKRSGSHRPDSGLTLMDRVGASVGLEGIQRRQSDDPVVQQFVQTNPVPRVSEQAVKKIAKSLVQKPGAVESTESIEDMLQNTIIGQKETKTKVTETIKRIKLGLLDPKRPHSFLFAGPSGTGKTETAKQLANYMYGDKRAMIRLDMSEFSEKASINRIKGSPDGYVGSTSKQPLPFDSLVSNPHQIILLDEIEKAHPDVRLLFMQILDEGFFTTERHVTVDFTKSIIIATTNSGVEELNTTSIGFNQPARKSSKDILTALKQDFPVELLNRFEHIVAFQGLNIDEYKQILAIKYNQLITEANNNRPDLTFKPAFIDPYDDDALAMLNQIAEDSFDPNLNGRPAERTIQRHMENHVLEHMNDTKQILFEDPKQQYSVQQSALPSQQNQLTDNQ